VEGGPEVSSEALRRLGRGEMTDEQYTKAVEWVREKWSTDECPFHSGATNWYIDHSIAETPSYAPLAQFTGGVVRYPSIVVICSICGYTVFVNAILAGVLPGVPAGPIDVKTLGPSEPQGAKPNA